MSTGYAMSVGGSRFISRLGETGVSITLHPVPWWSGNALASLLKCVSKKEEKKSVIMTNWHKHAGGDV